MDEEILALIDARAAEDAEFAALMQPRQNDGGVAAAHAQSRELSC